MDAVNWEVPHSGLNYGKNDVVVSFSYIRPLDGDSHFTAPLLMILVALGPNFYGQLDSRTMCL